VSRTDYFMKSYGWLGLFTHVTWLIHTCDMTHSHVWHDSFTRVTWLVHTCDHGWSGEGLEETSIHQNVVLYISDFSRFEWESLAIIRVSEYVKERKHMLCCAYKYVSPFLYTRGTTHSHTWHDSFWWLIQNCEWSRGIMSCTHVSVSMAAGHMWHG